MNTQKFVLLALATVFILSCTSPVGLGERLDIDGPVVEFTSPPPRKAVSAQFTIEGTAYDYSGVDRMVIKAVVKDVEFPRQWRYNGGSWQVCDHGGAWQKYADAEWIGSAKRAVWKIRVDLDMGGDLEEGEYFFSVQAWDKGGFSDDNSYKTLVLVIDSDPPKVEVSSPYLYVRGYDRGANTFTDSKLQPLHAIADDDVAARKNPANIGKFQTQEFKLQWLIDDNHDVWSIEIGFYDLDVEVDEVPETSLPVGPIYSYKQNTPPPPEEMDLADLINPNGSVIVPNLHKGEIGQYLESDGGMGELFRRITQKTTVQVVAQCYDAAGNVNQEKVLGYFIYWPLADEPWIVLPDGMIDPDSIDDMDAIDDQIFLIYPGREAKSTAFHAVGFGKVEYTIYTTTIITDTITAEKKVVIGDEYGEGKVTYPVILYNEPRFADNYSTIYSWGFTPPPYTAYYILEAKPYSAGGTPGDTYTAIFKVQDISFPEFPISPSPPAGDPLFMHIEDNTITISGIVTDATEIDSLCMAWINPKSRNYAAMSQLAYFRDKDYEGWDVALALNAGASSLEPDNEEWVYDKVNRNRLWKLVLPAPTINTQTTRHEYEYSQTINLSLDLGIGANDNFLKSQVFLLRAENPDGKCMIITYAPQGDTLAPLLEITEVKVESGSESKTYQPGEYEQMLQYKAGDTITISGTWEDDSTEYLKVAGYFKPVLTVNGKALNGLNNTTMELIYDDRGGDYAGAAVGGKGAFIATATVGTNEVNGGAGFTLLEEQLKDTFVIGVKVTDVGGNPAEAGASWLIESDRLRFLRISSEDPDQTYSVGDTIELFLEFSKPVRLSSNRQAPPILNLNTGKTASYRDGQTTENTRQYFTYTVATNDDTTNLPEKYLNVTGLYNANTVTNNNYNFTWVYGSGEDGEEVRIIGNGTPEENDNYITQLLPTAVNSATPGYMFTLIAGKRITIDTNPPRITAITANTPAGWYTNGDEIHITATFDKDVVITGTPQLTLNVTGGGGAQTSNTPADVRVNGKNISFVYRITAGASSSGNALLVSAITGGTITDLAGNSFAYINFTITLNATDRTLSGRYIDAIAPGVPQVRIISGATGTNVVSNSFSGGGSAPGNTQSGGTNQSESTSLIDLKTVYQENIHVRIDANGSGDQNLARIEYSTNGDADWVSINTTTSPLYVSLGNGSYEVIVRQYDRAGNVSSNAQHISFNVDSGPIITRISSPLPNGTYTNNGGSRQEKITITAHFRKEIYVSGSPTITLNAIRGVGTTLVPAIPVGAYSNPVKELSFVYTIADNDNTPGTDDLKVNSLSITAHDGNGNGFVELTSQLTSPPTDNNLNDSQHIKVQTGALSVTDLPTLTAVGGINDDNSQNAQLTVKFNHTITKGAGNITIVQNAANYRLPAVMTEAQGDKYRSIVPDFDTYYTRGTNGGTNGAIGGTQNQFIPDTATKYVLNYQYDTANFPTTGTAGTFATAFRVAEGVSLPVGLEAVEVSGNTLTVTLEGNNALQVPGATYTVTIPQGFVQDDLSYLSPYTTTTNNTIGGIAKPFIRVKMTHDNITGLNAATGIDTPRITVNQPLTTTARMDTRTPGTTIRYVDATSQTNVANSNWHDTNNENNGNTVPGLTMQDSLTTGNPTRPTTPTATGTGGTTFANEIPLGGNNPTIANIQGYQWRARAIAYVGAISSAESEAMAYRSVITYAITNNNQNGMRSGAEGVNFGNGDQIWIRGGDAISSSSIPGFPLTWEDKWNNLSGKRAGIRPMTMTTTMTNNVVNVQNEGNVDFHRGTWKWVTWEVNVETYYDIILGRIISTGNGTDLLNMIRQYGPEQFSPQRAGWTSFKDQIKLLPGKHRYLDTGRPYAFVSNSYPPSKGAMNFSGTWMGRPTTGLPLDFNYSSNAATP